MIDFLERLFIPQGMTDFVKKRLIGTSFFLTLLYLFALFSLGIKAYLSQKQTQKVQTPRLTQVVTLPDPLIFSKKIILSAGKTLDGIFKTNNVSKLDRIVIIDALRKNTNLKNLHQGKEIRLTYTPNKHDETIRMLSLEMRIGFDEEVLVERTSQGGYQVKKIKNPTRKSYQLVRGSIQQSFYKDALRAGTNLKFLHKIIQALGHTFDLQRDLHKGDVFRILFKKITNQKTKAVRQEQCLFVEVVSKNRTSRIYAYKHPKHPGIEFFDSKGHGLKSYFLRTPVDGARLTSGFGYRSHPILGYTKLHQGVDFAAPINTPIMAAGDGIVAQVCRKGGYGNYILIKHPGNYATAYAHLRRFKKGLRPGMRVRQGFIIGYLGATGRVTGPHLHFELIKNGRRINPKSVKMLPRVKLAGKDYKKFQEYIHQIKRLNPV